MNRRKIVLIVLGVVGVLVVASAAAFPAIVRARMREKLAPYGIEAEVAWVYPGSRGVVLRGVTLKQADLPTFSARFDRVSVSWTSPRHVVVTGGQIENGTSLAAMPEEVARLRARVAGAASDEGGQKPGQSVLEISGVSVRLAGGAAGGAGVDLADLAVRRAPDVERVSVGASRGRFAGQEISVASGVVEIVREAGDRKIGKLTTEGLAIAASDDVLTNPADLVPTAPPPPEPSADAVSAASKLRLVRARLAEMVPLLDRALAKSAKVELSRASVTFKHGKDTLNVGPALISLGKEDGGAYRLRYLSEAGADGKVLSVNLDLPTGDAPLSILVSGGPIALGTIGVKEGDFGLVEVDRASLEANAVIELAPAASTIKLKGGASVDHLSFVAKSVSTEPIRGLKMSFRGAIEAEDDLSRIRIENGEAALGSAQLRGNATFERFPIQGKPGEFDIKLTSTFEVPLVPCKDILESAPEGLLPNIKGLGFAGSFALEGRANFDTRKLDQTYDVDWRATVSCRVTAVPDAIDVSRFRSTFHRKVKGARGEAREIDSGPGSGNWAAYDTITRTMETAVITCEDGRFFVHDGFDHEAIKNSIRENLRLRKFVRGASTISMQLAKNIYLYRDKTLSRKLEEAILTLYLEQALTKEQILELYLNVVEFGPNVYGIDQAASHYFSTSPSRLHVSQAFYLASILPKPSDSHFLAGGALSPGWTRNLRTLMKHANKRKRLTDEQLESGLAEIPLRGSPAPMRDPNAESVPETPEMELGVGGE